MKEFVEKLISRLEEITEPIRPVGWSRKIEVVETKAVISIINQLVEEYMNLKEITLTMSEEEIAECKKMMTEMICVSIMPETNNNGWIPADTEVPPNDNYVLVSFENFSLPDIARYEEDSDGGAFYPGDEEKSYASFGLFVNAWQPLPEPYRPKGE